MVKGTGEPISAQSIAGGVASSFLDLSQGIQQKRFWSQGQRDDVLRVTQGVVTVATTVATPMNFPGWCRTRLVASSQVSDQSWTSSDLSERLWGA